MLNLMGVLNSTSANVSCTCNCKRLTSLQSMEITQLEFVQILVIVVVMMVMVVVITCLLNHYRLSARSLLSRHAPSRRRHLPLANEGSLWSSVATGTNSSLNEHQVYNPRPPDRGGPSSCLQRDPQQAQARAQAQARSLPPLQAQRFQHSSAASRFQPTYPYLPQGLVDLPPTICLSDGEEPPPYQGPCTLQLRDPEQQMELNRESVRAPPNRTVFDSHAINAAGSGPQASLQAPPPSVHSGVSVLEAQEALSRHQKQGPRVEGAPPTYSEVIGHYYHHPAPSPAHRTVSAPPPSSSSLINGGLLRPPPRGGSVDNRNAKEKSQKLQRV
ncbi:protein TMEPAI-like isoform X1 [Pseudoliparis swirei]|uniref:protein TMEPAI-like isoform X1 n=1 Tax=Pseudoliparis swirei TaxID=2059687 RepID=UPI0024BEAA37|nr:protein TMEPAI-like isoform X1 [Pseudoliparis swirei]